MHPFLWTVTYVWVYMHMYVYVQVMVLCFLCNNYIQSVTLVYVLTIAVLHSTAKP